MKITGSSEEGEVAANSEEGDVVASSAEAGEGAEQRQTGPAASGEGRETSDPGPDRGWKLGVWLRLLQRPDTSFIVVSLVHPNTLLQAEEAVGVLQKDKEENMMWMKIYFLF